MTEIAQPTRKTAAGFEMRPSPYRNTNPEAPDEVVLTDGKKRSFSDLFDYVNPLQHLPIVGGIYRAITGKKVDSSAQIVGGLLYGGPIGLASAAFNVLLEDSTGRDVSGHVMAAVGIGNTQGSFPALDNSALTAQNAPPPPPSMTGGVQLASFGGESGSLLTSWIAAPGQRLDTMMAQAAPQSGFQTAASVPAAAPVRNAPTASLQTVAATSPEPAATQSAATAGNFTGRSLVEYRATAINSSAGFRAMAPAGPVGVSRMPTAPVQTASLQTQPANRTNAAEAALSAPLQAQSLRDTGEADSYFAAQMASGLERYARMQRERKTGTQQL
jgi:hypothetical protein